MNLKEAERVQIFLFLMACIITAVFYVPVAYDKYKYQLEVKTPPSYTEKFTDGERVGKLKGDLTPSGHTEISERPVYLSR